MTDNATTKPGDPTWVDLDSPYERMVGVADPTGARFSIGGETA
ncbi:hypothetical protein [Nocardia sp. NBC_00403]